MSELYSLDPGSEPMNCLPQMLRRAWVFVVVVGLGLQVMSFNTATGAERNFGPWNLAELQQTPQVTWGETEGSVRQVYFAGEPYNGHATRVFAYYARPAKFTGKLPAMVLVHGGGGKAFKEWAELWAARGYAAIAMDLAGKGPDGNPLTDGGPDQTDVQKFDDLKQGAKQAWTYHAVADVIRAVSLLRSFEEIDPERIGITGISWGGYLTCIVSGLDDRLKVSVPVYGCGFLHEDSVWLGQFAGMAPELRAAWIKNFDPSQYLGGCSIPILFVNGTNDFAYPLDSYQKSYRLVRGPRTLCIKVRMPHGHPQGWAPEEIGLFVDSVLRDGKPFARVGTPTREDQDALAIVKSEVPLQEAALNYTTDSGDWVKREWHSIPAKLEQQTVRAKLPLHKGITYFFTVTDQRGVVVSTEHEVVPAPETLPQLRDPRLKIELFAESPQIVTPTGIDVDHRGRVWAIESNTHFPPADYRGHPTDRILTMRDTNGDGKADEITPFLDGLTFSMSVAARPNDDVYIATRQAIFLCRDDNGDGKADSKNRLVYLETTGNYPHNGLAGLAFDALGWMYFGFGENLGADYKIIGADGTTLSGGGEGGNVYRCRPDGTKLSRWATGFWNPHASCLDAFGRLFTVDNDPDSRPPCRLLHIVPQGDYGYRFRNGRKGLHPFTAWNGEIPGTLPMVAGTGEAPSGILAYESDGLPAEYIGELLVTSWGDHRIDRFRLKPKGTSFTSVAEPLVTGGDNFRPVGIAVAPDGSLYFTDWVLRDYKLHGQGRIWRISAIEPPQRVVLDVAAVSKQSPPERESLLTSPRLDVRRAAATALAANAESLQRLTAAIGSADTPVRSRIEAYWAATLAQQKDSSAQSAKELVQATTKRWDAVSTACEWFFSQLDSQPKPAPPIRLAELVGASPEKLLDPQLLLAVIASHDVKFSDLESVASTNDPFVFAMTIEALAQMLRNDPEGFKTVFVPKFRDPKTSAPLRLALFLATRLTAPRQSELFQEALDSADPALTRAAVQWIAEEKFPDFKPALEKLLTSQAVSNDLFLATLAGIELLNGVNPADIDKTPASQYALALLRDEKKPAGLRAQALRTIPADDRGLDAKLLAELVASRDPVLKLEAVRTLQSAQLREGPALLLGVASDKTQDVNLRADAIVGLAPAAVTSEPNDPIRKLLEELALSPDSVLQIEALRTLRGSGRGSVPSAVLVELAAKFKAAKLERNTADGELIDQLRAAYAGAAGEIPAELTSTPRPTTTADWLNLLATGGDADAGRRIFYHTRSAGCFKCHTVQGRGGRIGPDLSVVARTMNRQKLAESILEPSKEIPPQFVTWSLLLKSGKVQTGLLLHEHSDQLELGTSEGKTLEIPVTEIEERIPQKISIMPDKLVDQLTIGEFRNLLAFLETLK